MPTQLQSAAGWRMEPPVSVPSAAKAGNPVEVPGIARDAPGGILGGRAHGKLVHVGAAHEHGAGCAELGDDGGVVGRDVALEDFRRAGAGIAPDVDDIFNRDGHAAEGEAGLCGVGLGAGLFEVEVKIGFELGIDRLYALGELVDDFAGAEGAGG
jgi:hypothetical protein